MRLLVCGSRDWFDYKLMKVVLTGFMASYESLILIEGEQRGADLLARQFAEEHGLKFEPFPADWDAYRGRPYNPAGHERNQRMLDEGRPAYVLGFKDGFDLAKGTGGTEDMIRRASRAKISNSVVSHGGFF